MCNHHLFLVCVNLRPHIHWERRFRIEKMSGFTSRRYMFLKLKINVWKIVRFVWESMGSWSCRSVLFHSKDTRVLRVDGTDSCRQSKLNLCNWEYYCALFLLSLKEVVHHSRSHKSLPALSSVVCLVQKVKYYFCLRFVHVKVKYANTSVLYNCVLLVSFSTPRFSIRF